MEPQKNNEKTVVLQDEGLRKLKGFVQIPKAVLLCKEISYGAKVAYSILLGYAWQDEFCFPAQESLANDLGCSVRQARRFLVELKVFKFVT
jgi:helix-turn-helix protein